MVRRNIPLFWSGLLLTAAVAAAGCGSSTAKLVPVSGKVTLGDGAPLTAGQVTFSADTAKGNNNKVIPTGSIGSDGTYKIMTDGQAGAPVGAYKVAVYTVMPMTPGTTEIKMSGPPPSGPPPGMGGAAQLNPKFNDANQSGLTVTVSENPQPGAYDLKVTK